ncbi:MAG: DUF1015 family protein [Candidatus Caldatribacteriota bacterium]|nr:DUF1015 family protein [Candidatus Caldatribacteriota bacterium]
MAIIRPFKALRPKPELVTKVASPPYDVLNREEAYQMAKDNPDSFLHIGKSEIDLEPFIDSYDKKVYQKARENLDKMADENIYIQDEKKYIYIYRQIMDGRAQTGLVVCTSIDDYLNGVIKKHENTRKDKEQDRINHINTTDANTGPIFLTYRTKQEVNKLIIDWTEKRKPVYDFISEDSITHTCWVIDDEQVIDQLIKAFADIDYLYIADGHHRAASGVKVGLNRREQFKDFSGEEEFNYFLSVIFPDEELRIMDYNRVVADLRGNSIEEFINKVSEKFRVKEYEKKEPYKPREKNNFGMYLDNKWYELTAKAGTFDQEDVVERLDVSILQNNLLSPVLGIKDPRTDKRIEFIGGIRGLKELEKRVDVGAKVAFSLFPTSIKDLMAVADSGKVMPPKSTWFEPKLRSGIFIHKLSE